MINPRARQQLGEDLARANLAIQSAYALLQAFHERLGALAPQSRCNLALQANWLELVQRCSDLMSLRSGEKRNICPNRGAGMVPATPLHDVINPGRFAWILGRRRSQADILQRTPQDLVLLYGQMPTLSVSDFASRLLLILQPMQKLLGLQPQAEDSILPLAA